MVALPKATSMQTGCWLVVLIAPQEIPSWDEPCRFRWTDCGWSSDTVSSKAALASLSDALRLELAAWRIPVSLVEPGATDTQTFAKAEAAAQASLAAADPGLAGLYRDQLAAVGRAAARQQPGPVEPIARTIVTAVQVGQPKRRYTVGTGVRPGGMLARMPAGLRERAITAVFGLGKITTGQ